MTTDRWTPIAVGVLILGGTASYAMGGAFIAAGLEADGSLAGLNIRQIRLGALLHHVASAAVVAVGLLLYPVLREHNELYALGYAVARIVEATLLSAGALGVMSLVPLAAATTTGDAVTTGDAPNAMTTGDAGSAMTAGGAEPGAAVADAGLAAAHALATGTYVTGFHLALAALGAGGLLLCHVFHRTRLVPRPLAVLGITAYMALFASGWLKVFGDGMPMILYIPGAAFEIVLSVWLITKGLHRPETAPPDARDGVTPHPRVA